MACDLTEREGGAAVEPEATRTDWIKGERDVTGSFPQISDSNWYFARADAVRRAKEQLLQKYACAGGCDNKDDFCVLDVRVVENRSGAVERREVENPPDSFQAQHLGQRSSTHVYLTYELRAEAFCRCASPPRSPARPTGEVQTAQADTPMIMVPTPYGFSVQIPDIGAIVGGAIGAAAGAAEAAVPRGGEAGEKGKLQK